MLRQTPTSPAARLRAQTNRVGERTASIQPGATSLAMGAAAPELDFLSLVNPLQEGCRGAGLNKNHNAL